MEQAALLDHPRKNPFRPVSRWARSILVQRLQQLRHGQIQLEQRGFPTEVFGVGNGLTATVTVHAERFSQTVLWGGSIAVAEAYLREDWDCDDLTALIRILLQNGAVLQGLQNPLTKLANWPRRFTHVRRANHRAGSRKNIHAHYDLGNEFFELWLDETMAYSCGIFPAADASLLEASVHKFDRICQRLDLQPGDQLLDLGCGWGGFAMHAAKNYGACVTGITISPAQFQYVTRRIEAAGLQSQITIRHQDYRELEGQFDKIASIEMIEAVGHEFLPAYFQQVSRLLRPGGRFLLQSITMPERSHAAYLNSVDFIQQYIFPGGCLPSVSSLLNAAGAAGHLNLTSLEDFSFHYAETLRQWRANFQQKLATIRRQGYPESFLRMWTYYLCYCEAAFMERTTGVVQMQFDQPLAS